MKKLSFLVSPFSLLALSPLTASAQISGSTPGEFVQSFYKFALLASGVLAFGAIVWGGIIYTFAAGNPSKQSEGKEWVKSALLGLLLLAGAGLVLRTINPRLVNLSALPGLPPLTGPGPGPVSSSTCPIPPPMWPTGPLSSQMEAGSNTVIWNALNADVNLNLQKLKIEFDKFNSALNSDYSGKSVKANSVYRPYQYQQHLYELWDRWKRNNGGLEFNTDPNCASLKQVVGDDFRRHRIGSTVASPSCNAPHVKGIGIDLDAVGVSGSSANERIRALDSFLSSFGPGGINAYLQVKGIDLRWQSISGDEVHFNLQNPPRPSISNCNIPSV